MELFPAVTTTIIPVKNPANKAVHARDSEIWSPNISTASIYHRPYPTPPPWLPHPSRSSSSSLPSRPTPKTTLSTSAMSSKKNSSSTLPTPTSHTSLSTIIGSTPISSCTTHSVTKPSTITTKPNTSTLNCPTKTITTIPASCPTGTRLCATPDCAVLQYIEPNCDCPGLQVYTEFIDLACPATTDCPPASCFTDYETFFEPCPMTPLPAPGPVVTPGRPTGSYAAPGYDIEN